MKTESKVIIIVAILLSLLVLQQGANISPLIEGKGYELRFWVPSEGYDEEPVLEVGDYIHIKFKCWVDELKVGSGQWAEEITKWRFDLDVYNPDGGRVINDHQIYRDKTYYIDQGASTHYFERSKTFNMVGTWKIYLRVYSYRPYFKELFYIKAHEVEVIETDYKDDLWFVVYEEGTSKDIGNALVDLKGETVDKNSRTFGNGNTDFRNIQEEQLDVTISKEGYVTKNLQLDNWWGLYSTKESPYEVYLTKAHKLSIQTNPPLCDITIKNPTTNETLKSDENGEASLYLLKGAYDITVSKDKYETYEDNILISTSKTEYATLQKIYFDLNISTLPNSDIQILGTNSQTINSGDTGSISVELMRDIYTIKVNKNGYGEVSQKITLTKDTTLNIPLTKQKYDLRIRTDPPDCTVFVNQFIKNSGETWITFEDLEAGEISIGATKPEYKAYTETFNLVKDDYLVIKLDKIMGDKYLLTVVTIPSITNVTVNGETKQTQEGEAPARIAENETVVRGFAQFVLEMGEYTVLVEKEGYEPLSETITIDEDSNSETFIQFNLETRETKKVPGYSIIVFMFAIIFLFYIKRKKKEKIN